MSDLAGSFPLLVLGLGLPVPVWWPDVLSAVVRCGLRGLGPLITGLVPWLSSGRDDVLSLDR